MSGTSDDTKSLSKQQSSKDVKAGVKKEAKTPADGANKSAPVKSSPSVTAAKTADVKKKEHQNGNGVSASGSKTKVKSEPKEDTSINKSSSSKRESDVSKTPLNKKVKSEPAVPTPTSSSKSKSATSNGTNGKHSASQPASKTPTSVKKEVKSESKTPVKTPTSSKSASSSNNKKRPAEELNASANESPKKRKKKEEEQEEVWKWWEEKKYEDGRKWTTLEHKGPLFDPGYTPLPDDVHFFYNGDRMKLSVDAEEVMTFYAKMLDHDYTKKDVFNTNFFNDWRKFMNDQEKAKIKDLKKCDFNQVFEYFKKKSEERKAMSKEEKKALKEEAAQIKKEYGTCIWDGHKQPIGNYKIEPPGLFRGRGEHPKMGMVKRRIMPEDVIINAGKDSKVPQPPPGHKWKEVRHDNMVAWLCSWTENIQGNIKYVMLNASSRVKGERDWQKYEKARKLHRYIDKIRENYIEDWKSKEMKVRQRAVAIYFIDKLALRAGNEKDEDEADTVGCCSLRIEHVKLHKEVEGIGEHVVEFDFLGKDSIRYQNRVAVEKQVYKNLLLFMENKNPEDELFDRLNVTLLFLF